MTIILLSVFAQLICKIIQEVVLRHISEYPSVKIYFLKPKNKNYNYF